MTFHPPARLVGEPKKTKKKKKGRKDRQKDTVLLPKQWQTGYSPRPPTSSDQNQTLHGGWPAVCSYTCQVWSKSVKGLRRCGGGDENGPFLLLWPGAYTTACTTVQAVTKHNNPIRIWWSWADKILERSITIYRNMKLLLDPVLCPTFHRIGDSTWYGHSMTAYLPSIMLIYPLSRFWAFVIFICIHGILQ